MVNGLASLLIPYGYALVFILILLESSGLPLPGETLLILAAILAANNHLSIVGVVLCAAIGAILGDMGGYWIGRRGGTVLLKRILGRNYETHISKGRTFFDRYGAVAVFLARFVPGVRVVGANLAGVTEMPFSTFTLFNATGGLAWAVTMGSLAYFFGNKLPYLDVLLRKMGLDLIFAISLIATMIWTGRKISNHETKFKEWVGKVSLKLKTQKNRSGFVQWIRTNRGLAFSLTGGLLLAALSGWVFGALGEDVLARDSLTLYDASISRWLLSLATEDGSQFFYAITLLGGTWMILLNSILLGSWLTWRKKWYQLGALALSVGGVFCLTCFSKISFYDHDQISQTLSIMKAAIASRQVMRCSRYYFMAWRPT